MSTDAGPWPWRAVLADLLERTRLAQPDQIAPQVGAAAAPLGLDVWMYLADQEQRVLRPVPRDGSAPPAPLPIESTLAGRVFMTVRASASGPSDRPAALWMPLLDGTERLGVLEFRLVGDVRFDDPAFLAGCDLFSQLAGHLVGTRMPYGDALLKVRRLERMSEASELVWQLLPPLTFTCERAVVSAILEPCYEVGGDGFDYAVDGASLYFAAFDTAGHDLRSGLGTAVVMSAIRAARRAGEDLPEMVRAADRALERHLPELRFTTAVLGQLDLDSGRLRYVNAGHPHPLVIRGGKVVGSLDGGARLPLGLPDAPDDRPAGVAEEMLQPGDRVLLFTDGVTEARDRTGEPFGVARLAELVERDDGGTPAPETLRRLCHAALAHYDGPPADDATLVLVEWSRNAVRAMLPVRS